MANRLAGLSEDEAARRLRVHGPNIVAPEQRPPSTLGWVLKAISDPMAVLLLIASPTYLALGDYASAAVTAAALIPVTAVGLILERRAENALQLLRSLASPTASVIRGGIELQVPAQRVVPGDLVIVREGDVVPADGRIVQGLHVVTNEAALTGESLPVTKGVGLQGAEGELYAGTSVVAGQAAFEVTASGPKTRFGQVAGLVASTRTALTPLQVTVRTLITRLGFVAGAICLVVVAIQLLYGVSPGDAIIAGVSLAIAAIPEEFPLVFTLYLGLGAWRLTREKALVRRLAGVETLGSTTIICADKTGTLTRGELSLTAVVPIHTAGVEADEAMLLRAAGLACEPNPFDPLDVAILAYAHERGAARTAPASDLVRDYAFDPVNKYLTHVWRLDDGCFVAAKGAVEGVLNVCGISGTSREEVLAMNHSLAEQGQRVIAVAGGSLPAESTDRQDDERRLRFLGLIAFADPVREGVAQALIECRDAGIRVVMITGDHPVTAVAVAESLGLDNPGVEGVCTGDDIDGLNDDDFLQLARRTSIFARTRPEQKHRLVQVLRRAGEVVAMTGDGVNDAPALKEADIGVAMGKRGTAVAREAATLVLLDDNFATIVVAIREGRRIFESLRKAFSYLIGFHIPILLGALIIPITNEPLLLLPVNLVLLEILLHPTVALVFENDPAPEGLMRRPPRPRNEGLFRRGNLLVPLLTGFTLTASVAGVYLVRIGEGHDAESARSVALATLIVGQLFILLVVRSMPAPLWQASYRGNPALAPIVIGTLLAVVILVSVPGLNSVMGLQPLALSSWLLVALLAAVSTLWCEPFKAWLARIEA